MGSFIDSIKRLFGGGETKADPESLEHLRADFRVRYHSFKLLLSANNRALEVMVDIERALRSSDPFGMDFVNAASTEVSVKVLQIVRSLEALAPGNYPDLMPRYREIHESITRTLASDLPIKATRLVIPLDELDRAMADATGSKMATLGEIASKLRLRVPPGFVVTTLGYARFMAHNELQPEIDRRIKSAGADELDEMLALSSSVQQLVIAAEVPPDLADEMLSAYAQLERACGSCVHVSMRSSALGEDSSDASFAGQYHSSLNIGSDELLHTYKEIIASKYALHAMAYRRTRGIPDSSVAMCVGCMAMVDAEAGGVAYSRDPVEPADPSVVVTSVLGLPKGVVDGTGLADAFHFTREDPPTLRSRRIAHKTHAVACRPDEGLVLRPLDGGVGSRASISDDEAQRIAALAMTLEQHFGSAQDVEWAVDSERRIVVLQCRPVRVATVAPSLPDTMPVAEQGCSVLLSGGVAVSPGVGCGPVCRIRQNADLLTFHEGDVLVAAQPLPEWASVLHRAAAIVTEEGSIAGHLASVARELDVPALFGLAGAIDTLSDAALVTVDADRLTVCAGRVASALARIRPRRGLMEGSPVHKALFEVSRYIVPLNLLDPRSTDFHPNRCESLHDITRFCHEKSVQEMFRFGRDHEFTERSSKQLVDDVPMQLWVINLDDGFKQEVRGKYVGIANIASVPMLALWEGMRAIPWDGPPPVDAGGFMSVMFQATVNPELDPAVGGAFSERNYFMVSKQFCTLQSRFGFHFATVEALVGDRPSDNYASFRFRGGAADFARRVARVKLIAELLGAYGFRVETNDDALHARAEGFESDIMARKLRILGYLVHHTRQLDMVMSNPAAAQEQKRRMCRDIDSILGIRPQTT